MRNILTFRNLKVKLRNDKEFLYEILQDVEVGLGEYVMIKGWNGVGKSTLLNIIHNGFHHDMENKYHTTDKDSVIKVDFHKDELIYENILKDFDGLQQYKRNLSYLEQNDMFLIDSKAKDAVMFPSVVYAEETIKNKNELKKKLKEISIIADRYFYKYLEGNFGEKDFDIEAFTNKKVDSMSGGQRKIIHILSHVLKVEMFQIRLFLLDEPLNNLDSTKKCIVDKILSDLISEELTIILISHCNVLKGITKVLHISENQMVYEDYDKTSLKNCINRGNCLNK